MWLLREILSSLPDSVAVCNTRKRLSAIAQVAYGMAQELGFFLFSRQSLLLSGNVTQDGKYPIHQPQPVMREELRLLLSWMGCLQHDTRFKFSSS